MSDAKEVTLGGSREMTLGVMGGGQGQGMGRGQGGGRGGQGG